METGVDESVIDVDDFESLEDKNSDELCEDLLSKTSALTTKNPTITIIILIIAIKILFVLFIIIAPFVSC